MPRVDPAENGQSRPGLRASRSLVQLAEITASWRGSTTGASFIVNVHLGNDPHSRALVGLEAHSSRRAERTNDRGRVTSMRIVSPSWRNRATILSALLTDRW